MDETQENEQPPEEKIRLPRTKPNKIDELFAIWLVSNSYSRNTIKNYHFHVRKMLNKKSYISTNMIKAYLSTKNTIVKRSAMKMFLIFLEDNFSIKVGMLRYPRIKKIKKVRKPVSVQDTNKIIGAIRSDLELFAKVLFGCALRISECIRIRTEWFNWEEWLDNKEKYGDLKIEQAKRDKERIVPVHPKLMQEIFDSAPKHEDTDALKIGLLFDFRHKLYMYRKKRKGYTVEQAEARYVEKVYRYCERGIVEASTKALNKTITSHSLRSARASQLDELGVEMSVIRDLLGHDNLSTTSTYVMNTPKRVKDRISEVGV